MSPQCSQTQRASVSPGGTRCTTPAPQLAQNFIREAAERLELRVRGKAERIDRRARAVDPVDGEAVGLGAERVPAVGRYEPDPLLGNAQAPHRELVDLRRGLIDAQLIDAQHR